MLNEDKEEITCSCAQKYQEFDGTCNRLQSPRDGSSFTCLTRLPQQSTLTNFPCWNDERLFQEAKRIVIAEIQMITYNEFLRLVVGPCYYNNFLLRTLQNGFYTAYNPNINPGMINEFTSACFRFGHSTSQSSFIEIQSSGNRTNFKLRNNFFHPFDLYNGQTELLVRGLADQLAQKSDNFIVEDLTNHLYRRRGKMFGLDLMTTNIQRGRDHRIRPFVD
ncbi:chorion peroxidase-like [Tachypleus tridentatus]|uniref:chorion peroxidase-like n=1 Tax=Tachypleus tridentatus TaxID=6853 RepID=UPI003FD634ED